MTIGIMQGRLLPPKGRGIQFYPEEWQEEFKIASGLVDEIDFIFDIIKDSESHGDPYKQIVRLSKKYDVKVKHICADYFMGAPLSIDTFITNWIFEHIIGIASDIGADLEIPCLDNSSLKTKKQKINLVRIIREQLHKGVTISLETDLPPSEAYELAVKSGTKITYDTGNSASLGYDPEEEIMAYGNFISNVHIKDRVLGGGTVPLGEGDTDFEKVFHMLKKIGYNGSLTLQAARGEEGHEVETIKSQIEFVKSYL